MPLLTSPIDGSPMKQINRYGVSIDVCPSTGGIWLDKGELEKLLAIIREEALGEQQNMPAAAPYPAQHHAPHPQHTPQGYDPRYSQQGHYRRDHDDDDDDYKYRQGGSHYGKPHKKGKMSRIMDIFDL